MDDRRSNNSQLMSCLVQSRPRSSQQDKRVARVNKPTSSQPKLNILSNYNTSSSTTTLKVSQFSNPDKKRTNSALKDINKKLCTKNEIENVQPQQMQSVPQIHRNAEYYTEEQDSSSLQQSQEEVTNRVIEPMQVRPQSTTTKKPYDNSFLKSSSTTNVLRLGQRQQSPQQSRKQIKPTSAVNSSKVLKKTVNLSIKGPLENKVASRDTTPLKSTFVAQPEEVIQVVVEPITETKEIQEINLKFDIVLNKYKNSSFFSQDNMPTTLFAQSVNPEIILPIKPDTASASIVNKYITRVSRGKTLMGQVFTQKRESLTTVTRKRMNSPLHQRKSPADKFNFSQREGQQTHIIHKSVVDKLVKNRKKLGQTQHSSVTNPLFLTPFNEFGYHMTFLQYFHQQSVQFKGSSIPSKIAQLYNNNKETISYFEGIYKEHFLQTFHALQFCRDVQKLSLDEMKSKIVQLPPCKFKRTLIFDLDETLIHCNESNDSPADVTLSITFPSGETIDAGINVRPFCREMLQTLSQQFEIIVFTASHQCYASKVLDHLDPDKKLIHHRFFRDSCVIVDDGLHIKDLRVMGNRDMKNMLIVDNAAYSYYFQMQNGVPIAPFYDNQQDRELIYLTAYLLSATQQTDMLSHNMSYFKHNTFLEESSPEGTLARMF